MVYEGGGELDGTGISYLLLKKVSKQRKIGPQAFESPFNLRILLKTSK